MLILAIIVLRTSFLRQLQLFQHLSFVIPCYDLLVLCALLCYRSQTRDFILEEFLLRLVCYVDHFKQVLIMTFDILCEVDLYLPLISEQILLDVLDISLIEEIAALLLELIIVHATNYVLFIFFLSNQFVLVKYVDVSLCVWCVEVCVIIICYCTN